MRVSKRRLVNCEWFWERLDGKANQEKVKQNKKIGQNEGEIPD